MTGHGEEWNDGSVSSGDEGKVSRITYGTSPRDWRTLISLLEYLS